MDLVEETRKGHTETVKLLLDKGADVNMNTDNGDTALIEASDNGHIEIVKLLLDKGADVNAKNVVGNTALILAAAGGHSRIVSMLLNNGADVNATSYNGCSALKLATIGIFCVHSGTKIEFSQTNEDVVTLIKKHIHDKLMEEILKIALIVKKGITREEDKLLVPYAQRETIRHIASFF